MEKTQWLAELHPYREFSREIILTALGEYAVDFESFDEETLMEVFLVEDCLASQKAGLYEGDLYDDDGFPVGLYYLRSDWEDHHNPDVCDVDHISSPKEGLCFCKILEECKLFEEDRMRYYYKHGR